MILPGKLTIKHLEEHKRQGHKTFVYKHQIIDVDKLLKEYKGGRLSIDKHNTISDELEKNTEFQRSDIDSGDGDISKSGKRSRTGKS